VDFVSFTCFVERPKFKHATVSCTYRCRYMCIHGLFFGSSVLRFSGSSILQLSSSSVLRLWRLFATPRVNGPDQMPLFPGKRFSCPCISQWIDDIMWTPLGLPLPLALCGTIHILQICWARFVGLAIGMRLWIYSAFGDIICLALFFDFFALLLFFRVFFLWYYCYGIFCNSMWCGSHIWWAECSS